MKFKKRVARRAASEVLQGAVWMIEHGVFRAEGLLDENWARDPSVAVGPMTGCFSPREAALLRQRLDKIKELKNDIRTIAIHLRKTSHVPLGTTGA